MDEEAAQESALHEGSMSLHRMKDMKGHGKHHGMMGITGAMHKRREQMMAMRQAMLAELWQQLSALQEHPETLEAVTEQQEVLTELKKHQQMTDAFLATMVEQRATRHDAIQIRREKMKAKMGEKEL